MDGSSISVGYPRAMKLHSTDLSMFHFRFDNYWNADVENTLVYKSTATSFFKTECLLPCSEEYITGSYL